MSEFRTFDGLTLHYDVHGEGPPVVLVHSFGFDGQLWAGCGMIDALVAEGRQAVTLDLRGHGRSESPHGANSYGVDALAGDVIALLDHLAPGATDLAAFSMGSFISLRVLQLDERIRRAVLAGVGAAALSPVLFDLDGLPTDLGAGDAAALMGELAPHLENRLSSGAADGKALLEVLRAGFSPTNKDFSTITSEVLLLSGTRDDDPEPLAAAIPNSRTVRVDADHGSTMTNPDFVPAIVTFLSGDHASRRSVYP